MTENVHEPKLSVAMLPWSVHKHREYYNQPPLTPSVAAFLELENEY